MKKVTKLSLVAAVATLGFTGVNAQSLEEAIKNVDISGTAAYRYNNYKTDLKDGQNNYKIALNLSSKLDDNFKVNTRTIFGGVNFNTADKLTLNAGTQGDSQAIISLSEINFEFTGIEGTSIKVGKQAIVSPYAVAADALGNEQTGTGISASVGAGPLIASAAYFNQINDNDIFNSTKTDINLYEGRDGAGGLIYSYSRTNTEATNLNTGQNVATASLGLDFDIFKADLSYLGILEGSEKTVAFHVVGIGGSLNQEFSNGKIGFEARYSKGLKKSTVTTTSSYYLNNIIQNNTTSVVTSSDQQSLLKLAINGSYSIVNAKVTYLIGGDKGAKISLDEDSSATINGWATELGAIPNAKYLLANVNFDVLNDFNIAFNYNDLRAKNNSYEYTQSEYYTQLNYKLAKNLSTFIRYGNVKTKGQALDTRGRLQVVYSF